MNKLLTIDAFFLNEDRHMHNIAVLMNGKGDYAYCPIFDNGDGLLSDTILDYPLGEDPFDLIKEVRYLFIHGSPSHDHFTKTSSESINQLLSDLCIDTGVQQRDIQCHLHRRLAKLRQDHLLVNLLQDQRNRQDQIWFHFFEGFQQNFGRGHFTQQVDMRPDSHRYQEIERATIGMRQRQEGKRNPQRISGPSGRRYYRYAERICQRYRG